MVSEEGTGRNMELSMAKSERLSGICLEGLNKMAEHLYYNYQP
jgi:hypothetical protein